MTKYVTEQTNISGLEILVVYPVEQSSQPLLGVVAPVTTPEHYGGMGIRISKFAYQHLWRVARIENGHKVKSYWHTLTKAGAVRKANYLVGQELNSKGIK